MIQEGSALWKVLRKAYEQDFHIQSFPEQLGGAGLSALDQHIVAEEMGWGNAGIAASLGVTSIPFLMTLMSKNQELIEEFVVPFVQDREARYVGCIAITEPQRGSDWMLSGRAALRDPDITAQVKAIQNGDEWIINGQKSAWVSNGTIATHALLLLGIDPSQGMAGGGMAIVPLSLPGVSKGPPLDKLGLRALNQGEIFFDDVRIPRRYMLVEPGNFSPAMEIILANSSASIAATYTGVARAAFEEALRHCRERVQGGKPIVEHQLVQKKLFEMFTKVETARAISRAASLYNAAPHPPQSHYAVAAKVHCTQAAFEVASDAVQLFGGHGLSKAALVETLFRDARSSMIEIGANEVLSLGAVRHILEEY